MYVRLFVHVSCRSDGPTCVPSDVMRRRHGRLRSAIFESFDGMCVARVYLEPLAAVMGVLRPPCRPCSSLDALRAAPRRAGSTATSYPPRPAGGTGAPAPSAQGRGPATSQVRRYGKSHAPHPRFRALRSPRRPSCPGRQAGTNHNRASALSCELRHLAACGDSRGDRRAGC